MDQLLPHKSKIEHHLRYTRQTLFDGKYEILLYDTTSTHFEGTSVGNPATKRGHSRDNRTVGPQVLIGLVVTEEGYP